jgi:hypothetical protein
MNNIFEIGGKMDRKRLLTVIVLITISALLMVSDISGVPAQEPLPESVTETVAVLEDQIPIQGKLTNGAGNPLNGNHGLTFRLYEVASGGSAVCLDTQTVNVSNGLFTAYIRGCAPQVKGSQLWLGIQVNADPEMTPRQPIYAVPYALSLRPGAVISTSGTPALFVESTNSSGRGLVAHASATSGVNYGVWGTSRSPDGYGGYFYNNGGGIGLRSWSNSTTALGNHPAILGCAADNVTVCSDYQDDNTAGVMGFSQRGYGGYFVSDGFGGVYAISNGSLKPAVLADNRSGGNAMFAMTSSTGSVNATLYLIQGNSDGDFVVGASSLLGSRWWRVDRTGKGFFNGGTQTGGADFAEQMAVAGEEADYEPGDVLVISTSADQVVELSTEAFTTAVIGVYSTEPAVLAGAHDTDDPLEGIPVAITGIVPCKVSAENGPIQRGDLLVTSSTPGHAMRAGDNPPPGAILGKALGEWQEGSGVIYVLVALQ